MVKDENVSYKNGNKKNTMVVNLGKGGGVGSIIFLGGVLVTGIVASVLAVRKRNHKSIGDNPNNPKTSSSLHSFDSEQETKGLQFLVPNRCPEEHQQSRNQKADGGVTKAYSVTCSVSNENTCEEERVGLATEKDDEIIKHNLEVPSSGEVLDGCAHSEPGNRIQDVSSPSQDSMDSVVIEEVANESLDGEYTTEDEGTRRTLFMASQQYDDGEISSPMEINEASDTSSAEANIAVDDPIKKPSEENYTYEDDEILDDHESHETTEEVEDNSEGTLDSSAESNSDAIWPTETIQETGPQKDNVEKNHNEQGKDFKMILNTRNGSRTRFIDRYNLHLNLMKWKILLGTLLVLLLHLCFQYNVKEDQQSPCRKGN